MTTIRLSAFVRLAAAICATTGTSLALVEPAHAGSVVLWVCHGPEGQPLGAAPLMSNDSGLGFTMTYGDGCDGAGDLADGGALANFAPPGSAVPADSAAGWRVTVPIGTTLTGVALERATLGFGVAQPGDDFTYTASVPGTVLESASLADGTGPLTGAASFTTSGDEVDLELSCAAVPGASCAEPADPVGLELSSLGLTVTDSQPPHVAVAGVDSPVAGPLPLMVTATDGGLGLASATATLDGQAVASATFDGGNCSPLAAGNGETNLPLDADCPTSVADVPLTVATANVPDGQHQLVVTVTDVAGNTTTAVNEAITVRNHITVAPSTVLLAVGNGGSPGQTVGPGGSGVLSSSSPSSSTAAARCPSPRISAVLAGRPLRVSAHGVPVLWKGTRYLFTGRLTCVRNHRVVGAPDNTFGDIESVIAERVRVRIISHGRTRVGTRIEYRDVDRTGIATYHGGIFRVLLHAFSTRTYEFFYGTNKSRTLAKIFVIVTPHAYPRSNP